jgi:hypothetical protein
MITESSIYQFAQEIALLLVGIIIIFLTLLWGQRLGNRPVELKVDKLGVRLSADRLTLFFLVGFSMAFVGVIFRYLNYEAQKRELKEALDQVKSQMEVLRGELQDFKAYDLGLNLVFPEEVDPRDLKIQVYAKKQHENIFKLTDVKIVAHGPNGISWQCNDLEIPKTQVQMVRRIPGAP